MNALCHLADPPPYIDGVRINSPHYLCKLLLPQAGVERYTLVISQYEKSKTINYSLRVYSTCPFELKKITQPYKHKDEVSTHIQKYILCHVFKYRIFCFRLKMMPGKELLPVAVEITLALTRIILNINLL